VIPFVFFVVGTLQTLFFPGTADGAIVFSSPRFAEVLGFPTGYLFDSLPVFSLPSFLEGFAALIEIFFITLCLLLFLRFFGSAS